MLSCLVVGHRAFTAYVTSIIASLHDHPSQHHQPPPNTDAALLSAPPRQRPQGVHLPPLQQAPASRGPHALLHPQPDRSAAAVLPALPGRPGRLGAVPQARREGRALLRRYHDGQYRSTSISEQEDDFTSHGQEMHSPALQLCKTNRLSSSSLPPTCLSYWSSIRCFATSALWRCHSASHMTSRLQAMRPAPRPRTCWCVPSLLGSAVSMTDS